MVAQLASPPRTDAASPPAGWFEGDCHVALIRVYFEDTDLSGMVYHANYLRWFERARSDLLRLLGIDQHTAFAAGEGAFAVTDLALRYRAPARLDDAVRIETRVRAQGAASCRLAQRAVRGHTLLTQADVRVGFVAPDGRPRRLPALWRQAFAGAPALTGG